MNTNLIEINEEINKFAEQYRKEISEQEYSEICDKVEQKLNSASWEEYFDGIYLSFDLLNDTSKFKKLFALRLKIAENLMFENLYKERYNQ